ncbi:hypothetical protein AB1Y20_018984 [Prymnesium parvum]|uniref:NADP-dependent oxidoreductase domain-containing protein n=1 Tax=Prymnesium parvum TaxID=97485 RepID=A0AB34JR17_PRYPA
MKPLNRDSMELEAPHDADEAGGVPSDKSPLYSSEGGAARARPLHGSGWLRVLLAFTALLALTLVFHGSGSRDSAARIPTRPLLGGGTIPMMMMGGDDFVEWFKAAGAGAAIQNFYSYGNGPHIAPQVHAFGREKVFISTGIPCGCCGYDAPKIQPMNSSLAMGYIDDVLRQLNTTYADLLLLHHRCHTANETASVWRAFEAAKRSGKARHIGVSNFNAHDLATLLSVAVEPVEVLEAHFGVGVMDFEVLELARKSGIQLVGFASLSMAGTDLPTLAPAVSKVAASHGITNTQVMYAYLYNRDIVVLSSCFHKEDPSRCASYYEVDLAVFDIRLSAEEMSELDNVTLGRRTCTDCFTDQCQECAKIIHQLGCPLLKAPGQPTLFPVWGRGNKQGTQCVACASLPQHRDDVIMACGSTLGGESFETMVPKACGI